jgi:hypothetical protein
MGMLADCRKKSKQFSLNMLGECPPRNQKRSPSGRTTMVEV